MVRVSFPTANSLIAQLVQLGVLEETTGGARKRLFAYQKYLDLFTTGLSDPSTPKNELPVARTESDGPGIE
jgi:hypothetical protein